MRLVIVRSLMCFYLPRWYTMRRKLWVKLTTLTVGVIKNCWSTQVDFFLFFPNLGKSLLPPPPSAFCNFKNFKTVTMKPWECIRRRQPGTMSLTCDLDSRHCLRTIAILDPVRKWVINKTLLISLFLFSCEVWNICLFICTLFLASFSIRFETIVENFSALFIPLYTLLQSKAFSSGSPAGPPAGTALSLPRNFPFP